jgi:molybdenum cofactor synthesis domain-containing protein
MCEACSQSGSTKGDETRFATVAVSDAVGMVLAHDITEIKKDDFKGRAFKKGHIVRAEDVERLKNLGKENLYVLDIAAHDMHEDEAAYALAGALMGPGVAMEPEPKEGKINLLAEDDGLLKIDVAALNAFNFVEEVMCATLHTNMVVKKGRVVAGARAIPLVISRARVAEAVLAARKSNAGVIRVLPMRRPRCGVVITGSEVYHGRIQDAFAPVIKKKIEEYGGEILAIHYAPDDAAFIEEKLRELLAAGADLLITTGGMSVDPDDVTRFAVRNLGVTALCYGSAVLPGAMFMVAYAASSGGAKVPVLGIPACGMYSKTTVFDLVLPRVLSGENIGRHELAELGHGGLCMNCKECRYPVCPFGKY